MKFKLLFRLLLLIALILLLNDAFARAGGGGGGGGSGGGGHGYSGYGHNRSYSHSSTDGTYPMMMILLVVVILIIGCIVPALLKLKSHFSTKIITHASNKDSFWDADQLKHHAEKTFRRMQRAWQERNTELVKSHVTAELYTEYKIVLNQMKKRHEKSMLSNINFTETRIIGCEDFKDDSKDRYTAYIKGTLLDYTIDERFDTIIKNQQKTIEHFIDTYHFVRINNDWILEKIDNTVTVQDIFEVKNYIEK